MRLQARHKLPMDERGGVGLQLPPGPNVEASHGYFNQPWANHSGGALLLGRVCSAKHGRDQHDNNTGHGGCLWTKQVGCEVAEPAGDKHKTDLDRENRSKVCSRCHEGRDGNKIDRNGKEKDRDLDPMYVKTSTHVTPRYTTISTCQWCLHTTVWLWSVAAYTTSNTRVAICYLFRIML